jgi:stress-induced morphogen
MPLKIRGPSDECLEAVKRALAEYELQHPRSEIEAYRQNDWSIRVRIVDPDFKGASRTERDDRVWQFLDELPEEVQGHISFLLLLTPEERKNSQASFEFDDPIPSKL